MADLLALVSQGSLSKKELSKALVSEYFKVCGEYGLEIFQEKILPHAFEKFGKDHQLLTKKVLYIIELAGDCKSLDINDYLLSVDFKKMKPKKSLEEDVKKLEGLLVVYNQGKDS